MAEPTQKPVGDAKGSEARTQGEYETLEHGDGFPLVLFHGLMGEPANWAKIFPYLPNTCRAMALTFPFFEDEIPLKSIPAIRDYARGYLEETGIERAVLCGNSLGGHVSLHLALDIPERVAGLVLTGSSGLFEREMGAHRGANPPREWVYTKMCEIFFDKSIVTEPWVDAVCRVMEKRSCRRDLLSIAKSAKRDNLADRLRDVRCPSLLIWGRQDTITPPDVAEEFHSLLPNSTLAWVDRCGHAPMMERPDEFGRLVGRWLGQVSGLPEQLAERGTAD